MLSLAADIRLAYLHAKHGQRLVHAAQGIDGGLGCDGDHIRNLFRSAMRATDGRVSLLQVYVKLLLAAAAAAGVAASAAVANPHYRAVALKHAMRQLPELLRLIPSAEADVAAAAAASLAADISRLMAAAGLDPAPEPAQAAEVGQPGAFMLSHGARLQPPPPDATAGVFGALGAVAAAATPLEQPAASPTPPVERGLPSVSHSGGDPAVVTAAPTAAAPADLLQCVGLSADRFACGPGSVGGDACAGAGQHSRELLQQQAVPPREEPLQQEGSGESLPVFDQLLDFSLDQTGDLDLDGDLLDLINSWQTEPPGSEGVPATPFPGSKLDLFDDDVDDDGGVGCLGLCADASALPTQQPLAASAAQVLQPDQQRGPGGAAQAFSMATASPASPGMASSGVDAAAAALDGVCLAASPEAQQSLTAPESSGAPVAPLALYTSLAPAVSAAGPVTEKAHRDGSASRLVLPQGGGLQPVRSPEYVMPATADVRTAEPRVQQQIAAAEAVTQTVLPGLPLAAEDRSTVLFEVEQLPLNPTPLQLPQQAQHRQPQQQVQYGHQQFRSTALAAGMEERSYKHARSDPADAGAKRWPAEWQAGAWTSVAAALPLTQPPHSAPVHSGDQAAQYSAAQWRPQGTGAGAAVWQAQQRPEERWDAAAAAGGRAVYGSYTEAQVPSGHVGSQQQLPHHKEAPPQPQALHHQQGSHHQGYHQQQQGQVPQDPGHGWHQEGRERGPRQGPVAGGYGGAAPGAASAGHMHSALPMHVSRNSSNAGEAHGPNSLTQWLPLSSISGHTALSESGALPTAPRQPNRGHAAAMPQSHGGPGTSWHQHSQPRHQLPEQDAGAQAALRSSSSCDGAPLQHKAARGGSLPHPAPPQHDASYALRLSSPGYAPYMDRAPAAPTAASGAGAAVPAGPQAGQHSAAALSDWRQHAGGVTSSVPLDSSGRASGTGGAASAQAPHEGQHYRYGQQAQLQARHQAHTAKSRPLHHHYAQGVPPPPAVHQAFSSAPVPGAEARSSGAPPPCLQSCGSSMPFVPGMTHQQQPASRPPALQQPEWRSESDGQHMNVDWQQRCHQRDPQAHQPAPGMAPISEPHGASGRGHHHDMQPGRQAASCSGVSLYACVARPDAAAAANSSTMATGADAATGVGMPPAAASAEPAQRCLRTALRGMSWSGARQGFASHPASPVMGGCETQGKRPASWLYEDMVGEHLPLDDEHDQANARLQQCSFHAPGAPWHLGRAHSALIGAERATAAVAPLPQRVPARSCDGLAFSPPLGTRAADGLATGAPAGAQQQSGVADGRGAQPPRVISIYTESASAAACGTESWECGSDASPASNNYCSSASARPPWDALRSGAQSATVGRAGGRDSRRRLLEGHRAASPHEARSTGSGPASGANSRHITRGALGSGAPCYLPVNNSTAQHVSHGRLSSSKSAPYEWTDSMDLEGPVASAVAARDPWSRNCCAPSAGHGAAPHDPRSGRQAAFGTAYPGLRSAPQDWYVPQGTFQPELTDAEIDMLAEAGIEPCGRAVKRSCSRVAMTFSNGQSAFSGAHGGGGAVEESAMGTAGPGAYAMQGAGGAGGGDSAPRAPGVSAATDTCRAAGPAQLSGEAGASSIDGSYSQGAPVAGNLTGRGWYTGGGGGQGTTAVLPVHGAGGQSVGAFPTAALNVNQQEQGPPPQLQQQQPEAAWATAQRDEAPGSHTPRSWQPQPQSQQVHQQPQSHQYHSQSLQHPSQGSGGGAGSWAQLPATVGPTRANADGSKSFGSRGSGEAQAARSRTYHSGSGASGDGDVAGERGCGGAVVAAAAAAGGGSAGLGHPNGSLGDDDAHELTFSVRGLAMSALQTADVRSAPQKVRGSPQQPYHQPQQQQQQQRLQHHPEQHHQQHQSKDQERLWHAQPAQNIRHQQAAHMFRTTTFLGQRDGPPAAQPGTGAPGFSFAPSRTMYSGHPGNNI